MKVSGCLHVRTPPHPLSFLLTSLSWNFHTLSEHMTDSEFFSFNSKSNRLRDASRSCLSLFCSWWLDDKVYSLLKVRPQHPSAFTVPCRHCIISDLRAHDSLRSLCHGHGATTLNVLGHYVFLWVCFILTQTLSGWSLNFIWRPNINLKLLHFLENSVFVCYGKFGGKRRFILSSVREHRVLRQQTKGPRVQWIPKKKRKNFWGQFHPHLLSITFLKSVFI